MVLVKQLIIMTMSNHFFRPRGCKYPSCDCHYGTGCRVKRRKEQIRKEQEKQK